MIQTRLMTDGMIWSLLALTVTWANDSGAYFMGKRWGKRKLWPSISPNKTVEGSLGGMLLSLIISAIIGLLFPELGSLATVLGIGSDDQHRRSIGRPDRIGGETDNGCEGFRFPSPRSWGGPGSL